MFVVDMPGTIMPPTPAKPTEDARKQCATMPTVPEEGSSKRRRIEDRGKENNLFSETAGSIFGSTATTSGSTMAGSSFGLTAKATAATSGFSLGTSSVAGAKAGSMAFEFGAGAKAGSTAFEFGAGAKAGSTAFEFGAGASNGNTDDSGKK